MQVTFHRAFDWTRDPFAAFDAIAAIPGITRILTSGQQKSALEGLPLIIELMKRARPTHGNPTPPLILPGGDINARTLPMIQHFISLDPSAPRLAEVHASASSTMVVPGYRNSAVSFAPLVKGSDGTRSVGDGAKVAGLVRILGAAGAPS